MTPSLLSDILTRLAHLSDTPALDASVLLARIVERPRSWILAHPELTLTDEQQNQLDASLARLEKGESFPYVLGRWEFFGLEFEVTPDVLIPRPETELLVEKAIAWLQKNPTKMNVADIGAGSGAIAVSIAVNVPSVNILATDISSKALDVARRNAEKNGVSERIEFVECDLLPESKVESRKSDLRPSTFDLICSNLPYIPTNTLKQLPIYGREPTLALDGGDDGLDLFRKLLSMIPDWLAPNALILLEIESTLGEQTMQLARQYFQNTNITLHQDLTGRDRLLEIQT
ncbi:MAG TPA: peptide chain release factor N(5)-glutamine methyltransferase [Anaerolineales bacterium]|jgi:release factor glutamine methyltransferase|nr:peptide chain release factor N(5)-glutamine methyltransferase [Anaerolineales bacterium]